LRFLCRAFSGKYGQPPPANVVDFVADPVADFVANQQNTIRPT